MDLKELIKSKDQRLKSAALSVAGGEPMIILEMYDSSASYLEDNIEAQDAFMNHLEKVITKNLDAIKEYYKKINCPIKGEHINVWNLLTFPSFEYWIRWGQEKRLFEEFLKGGK